MRCCSNEFKPSGLEPTPLGESLQASVRDCLLHVRATIEIRPQFDPVPITTRQFSVSHIASILPAAEWHLGEVQTTLWDGAAIPRECGDL
jgi:hypothetical protein